MLMIVTVHDPQVAFEKKAIVALAGKSFHCVQPQSDHVSIDFQEVTLETVVENFSPRQLGSWRFFALHDANSQLKVDKVIKKNMLRQASMSQRTLSFITARASFFPGRGAAKPRPDLFPGPLVGLHDGLVGFDSRDSRRPV